MYCCFVSVDLLQFNSCFLPIKSNSLLVISNGDDLLIDRGNQIFPIIQDKGLLPPEPNSPTHVGFYGSAEKLDKNLPMSHFICLLFPGYETILLSAQVRPDHPLFQSLAGTSEQDVFKLLVCNVAFILGV